MVSFYDHFYDSIDAFIIVFYDVAYYILPFAMLIIGLFLIISLIRILKRLFRGYDNGNKCY